MSKKYLSIIAALIMIFAVTIPARATELIGWEFTTDTEGWSPELYSDAYQSDGALVATFSNVPLLKFPLLANWPIGGIVVDGSMYVHIRLKNNSPSRNLLFQLNDEYEIARFKTVVPITPNSSEFIEYNFDLSSVLEPQNISSIYITVSHDVSGFSGEMYFDYIRIDDVPASPTETPTLTPTATETPDYFATAYAGLTQTALGFTPTYTASPTETHTPTITPTFTPSGPTKTPVVMPTIYWDSRVSYDSYPLIAAISFVGILGLIWFISWLIITLLGRKGQ